MRFVVKVGPHYIDCVGCIAPTIEEAFAYRNFEWALRCAQIMGGKVETVQ